MEQDEYLAEYEKEAKRQVTKGIPNFKMNKPLVTNALVGTVGLELELEAANLLPNSRDCGHVSGQKTGAMWRGIADGSLRGNSLEYVLSLPCGRDEIRPLIEGLYETMGTYKTKLKPSNRCSTHVHINMAGKGINEITSAIVLWGVFEQAFISYCGEERKTNHFCLSSKETKSTIEAWSNLLNYGTVQFNRNIKYSALNILPLHTLGSLEFRCGRASPTPEYPVIWATLIDTLVSFAATRYPNPRNLANELSERGAIGMLEDIVASEPLLPATLVGQIIDASPGFENECLTSFRNYQELALSHPWEEWIELINTPYIPNPFGKSKVKPAYVEFDPLNPPPIMAALRDQIPNHHFVDEPVVRHPAPLRTRGRFTPTNGPAGEVRPDAERVTTDERMSQLSVLKRRHRLLLDDLDSSLASILPDRSVIARLSREIADTEVAIGRLRDLLPEGLHIANTAPPIPRL